MSLNAVAENILTSLDPDREADILVQKGLNWTALTETADLLDATTKPLLAQFTQEVLSSPEARAGKGMSFAAAESKAMADSRYEAHLKAASKARGQANAARVRYESAKVRIDLYRTLIATKREEMRMGGMVK